MEQKADERYRCDAMPPLKFGPFTFPSNQCKNGEDNAGQREVHESLHETTTGLGLATF